MRLIKFYVCALSVGLAVGIAASAFAADPPNEWTNWKGDFLWGSPENWSLGRVPQGGDVVVFNSRSVADCIANTNTVAQYLNSITVASNYLGKIYLNQGFAAGGLQDLTVVGDIDIQGGTVICASTIVSSNSGYGVTIRAANFTLGAGGVLHADGKGFGPLSGPGAADSYNYGASHGGRGERNLFGSTYGDPAAPVTLGSGGGDSTGDGRNREGGGAIALFVDGSVTVDGKIRCNGLDRGFHNTGAGGSVWITCSSFAGSGLIQARGGNISADGGGRYPGGGGRVAVSYTSSSFSGTFDVQGGRHPRRCGETGTLCLPAGSDIVAKPTSKIGLAPGSHSFRTLTVQAGGELFCHSTYPTNDLLSVTGCVVIASNATIESTGVMSADSDGYAATVGPGGSTSGASHGGRGGGGKSAYGDVFAPATLGSGGLDWNWGANEYRHWGGGAIKLVVSNSLTVNGTLRSNDKYTETAAGGSGGSIWINCFSLAGTGSIQANGGSSNGVGGNASGGRIAVYYTNSTFTGITQASGSGTGESGSVVPGGIVLANHLVGQVTNLYSGASGVTNVPVCRFSLRPTGNTDDTSFETMDVTRLVFDLDLVAGFISSDITNLDLYVDTNTNGLASDEAGAVPSVSSYADISGSNGTVTLDFAPGTLVLDGSYSNSSFILEADASNLTTNHRLRITLNAASSRIGAVGTALGKPVNENNASRFAPLTGGILAAYHGADTGPGIDHYDVATESPVNCGIVWPVTVLAKNSNDTVVAISTYVSVSSERLNASSNWVPENAINFYSDPTCTQSVTGVLLDSGIGTVFAVCTSTGTVRVAASDISSITGTSAQVEVLSGGVSWYKVSADPDPFKAQAAFSPQTKGIGFTGYVHAVDAYGQFVSNVSDTISLYCSGSGLFYSDSACTSVVTSVSMTGGSVPIYIKDNTIESIQISAADSALKSGMSSVITINWTIQDEINAATPGSTLVLTPGTYHETFVVNKSLTITTPSPTSTVKQVIIDGDNKSYAIKIEASDVTVEGLEVRNATNLVISGSVSCTNVTVQDCVVHSALNTGIWVDNVNDNFTVQRCSVYDTRMTGIKAAGWTQSILTNVYILDNEVFNGCQGTGDATTDNGFGIQVQFTVNSLVAGNYVHDLNGPESAISLYRNMGGLHVISNNVMSGNYFKRSVGWAETFEGSAIALKKPTIATGATIRVVHNTIVGNSGTNTYYPSGHGIVWYHNGCTNLTMEIYNNLIASNGAYSFVADYEMSAGQIGSYPPDGFFDYNNYNGLVAQPTSGYASTYNLVGVPNNITSQPIFVGEALGSGKYQYALATNSPSYCAGSDGLDMGALLNTPVAPHINSPLSTSGIKGVPFLYTITAYGSPVSFIYTADPLPPGLSLAGNHISGTPTAVGTYNVSLTCSNGVLPNDSQTLTIEIAVPTTKTLTVVSSMGTATPAPGIYTNEYGTALTNSVSPDVFPNGATQIVCSGWSITHSFPISGTGTSMTMTVMNDSVLTWNWKTQYLCNIMAGAGGTINRSTGWQDRDPAATFVATPNQTYSFVCWTNSGTNAIVIGSIDSPTVTVAVTAPLDIMAIFVQSTTTRGTPLAWLLSHSLTNDTPDEEDMKDMDLDGMLAWQEWVANTDPTNGESLLEITDASVSGTTNYIVQWAGMSGRLYSLLRSTNLINGFSRIASNLPPVTPMNVYTDKFNGTPAYYRIGVKTP